MKGLDFTNPLIVLAQVCIIVAVVCLVAIVIKLESK